MSFLDLLQNLGDRLGILEASSGPAAQPAAKIQTRTVTLAELTTEISREEVRALADLPAELTVTFEMVFESAGVHAPVHGWTVDRLGQLLQTDALKDKDREAAQKAILGILNTEKVPVEDIVRDAISRDQALDSFEAFARRKMEDRMAAREHKVAEIKAQIKNLQSELNTIEESGRADEEKWREWRRQKRARERDLATSVSYLIDRQVITTDTED